MTPEQEQDSERLQRYIFREGLTSVMSDAKWREARAAIEEVFGPRVWFRAKDVREDEPPPGRWWETDFKNHGPQSYAWVEWLEIDPVVSLVRRERGEDRTEALQEALQSKGVPFYILGGGIVRIPGYIRERAKTAGVDQWERLRT